MSDATRALVGNDESSVDDSFISDTGPVSKSVGHLRHKLLSFVVPVKHRSVNSRNDRFMCGEHDANVSTARPVVRPVVVCTPSSTEKRLCTSSNMLTSNKSVADEVLWPCDVGKEVDQHYSEPTPESQSEIKESVVFDASHDKCISMDVVSNVGAKNAPLQHQASASSDPLKGLSVMSRTLNVRFLPEKVVDAERPSGLLSSNSDVQMQRLVCRDNQLKRIANKTKLKNIKWSPGSLLVSRKNVNSRRLSLKDAVGGMRPRAYSLSEVDFTCL